MLELKDVSVVFNEGTVNEKVALNNIKIGRASCRERV